MGFLVTTLPIGFPPHWHTGNSGGHLQPVDKSLKVCFTIRSSKEWNVMMAILPPGFITLNPSLIACSIIPNSLLTSILMAWKVLLAGCGPSCLALAGIAALMMSTNSKVVLISPFLLASTMNLAILEAHFSSP